MLDHICMFVALVVALATSLAVYRRLGPLGLYLLGIFLVAIDGRLYWPQYLVIAGLKQAGIWENVARSSIWSTAWTILPTLLLALFACGLWRSASRIGASPAPRVNADMPG